MRYAAPTSRYGRSAVGARSCLARPPRKAPPGQASGTGGPTPAHGSPHRSTPPPAPPTRAGGCAQEGAHEPRCAARSAERLRAAGKGWVDLGSKIQYVDSSFAKLVDDLSTDKCDVAMFAVGVLPARAKVLRFSQPYLQSDIYGVTTRSNRTVKQWADIDKPGVLVAVQAGTFMEPVMAAALKQAKMVVVKPPQTREQELESGRVDVFMTDYPYSRRLLDNADWAKLVSPPQPFNVLPYAYAVKPGDDAWLKKVDEFVARIKKDGRLDAAAKRAGLSEIVIRP
ncbi:MAG: amino acid ABC transporter substrate-binding protein [Ideonella sp. MAG2]|nr:MAG: amino acid ABC transporter substrate-binding protein [Ideonella sp. MAG2]